MEVQGHLHSPCALISPGSSMGEQEPFQGAGLRGKLWGAGLGEAEVFHHAADVWCQQGTAKKHIQFNACY